MAGSGFGTNFRITTWGETHGAGVGVVVDGCPAGLPLEREDVQKYLDRRKPGQSKYTTQRKEGDQVEILSGIFEGRTTGTPISMVVYNKDQRSKDYSNIKDIYRPGHADFTFDMKYGFRDYRGGGRSSGRETIGRVAAGAVAAKVLKELGIEIKAYAKAIAGIEISKDHFDFAEMNNNPFNMPDKEAAKLVQEKADQMIKEMDSIGGIIECQITGMPVGIGETVFDKLDAELSKAIMYIGSVKGFEIGDGFEAANLRGSENNDDFHFIVLRLLFCICIHALEVVYGNLYEIYIRYALIQCSFIIAFIMSRYVLNLIRYLYPSAQAHLRYPHIHSHTSLPHFCHPYHPPVIKAAG